MIGRTSKNELKDKIKDINNKVDAIKIEIQSLKNSLDYIKKLLRKLEARKK